MYRVVGEREREIVVRKSCVSSSRREREREREIVVRKRSVSSSRRERERER